MEIIMDVDQFLEKLKNRPVNHKGKLAIWHDDILKLRSAGCTYAQIVEYLELKEVRVSIAAVQKFCTLKLKKNEANERTTTKNTDNLSQVANEEVAEDTEKRPTEQTSSEAPTLTDKNSVQSKTTEDEEVPVHKRMPDWFNVPGFNSIDDLC